MGLCLPSMYRVRQELYSEEIEDVRAAVRASLTQSFLGRRVKKGDRIALTAGSRGIDRIDEVLGGPLPWRFRSQGRLEL